MKPTLNRPFSTSVSTLTAVLVIALAASSVRAEANLKDSAAAVMQDWLALRQSADEPSALPAGAVLDHVVVEGEVAAVYLRLPADFLANLTEAECEVLIGEQVSALRQIEELRGFALLAAPIGDASAEFLPLPAYLPPLPPAEDKPEPEHSGERAGGLPTYNPGKPVGALTGKTVFLNPGHGWYYSTTLGRWATQRGNSYGIIEDMSNGESVLYHLARYFHNAGANVWTCRERDFNPNMVILDNVAGSPGYTTTGSWITSTSSGTPYAGNYQYAAVSPTETAIATYAPAIPATGDYAVYVWTPSASNRATDATVRVKHTGGTTTHVINMQRDGNTWRFLGQYHFAAGRDPQNGAVEISNQGSDTSKFVIADAVRFGGGMGDYVAGGAVSGFPRWEESGAYYPVFMGQLTSAGDTVSAMPRYAKWESESWEDSIYIAWHSNASNGSGHGSSVWVYGPGSPPSPFGEFSGVAGSDALATRVRDEMRTDIRAAWTDPSWPANLYSAWFGELNPSNNDEMPAILLEVAYHDSATDADTILDPRWRDLTARAVYQGTVKWWHNDANGPTTTPIAIETLLPEPPTHVSAVNLGGGSVRVRWNAPPSNSGNGLLGDPATGYLVQVSSDGYGFDNGTATSANSFDFGGLPAGQVRYFRVIATNAGGQSFASEIAGVRVTSAGAAPILVVNGFDRIDRAAMLNEDDPYDADPMVRERPDRMNSYAYVRTFAESLHYAGVDFDYASNEAVRDGIIALSGYTAVIWQLGEESTPSSTFDATEQSRVMSYLNAGGRLFVSGSETAWDLDNQGSGAAFCNNYLKTDYVADDAGTYTVAAGAGSIFEGIPTFTFDDGASIYNVDFPDAIAPLGGATTALSYVGGTGGTAGIVYSGTYRVVNFGFPFEAVSSPARRTELLVAILEFFGFDPNEPPPPPPADVIVEARDAAGALTPPPAYVESGAWANSSIKSTAGGLSGTGSRFITYVLPNTGTDNADFVPHIAVPGRYEVFVTWANGADCYDSLQTVRHFHGSTAQLVDQIPSGAPEASNANTWVSLGQYWFAAGQALGNGSVNISEATVTGKPSTTWNDRVYTDAAKWVFVRAWPNGDYDQNGQYTLADFAHWPDCLTGPLDAYAEDACVAFDFDLDGDVDLEDFVSAQAAFAP